jgi:pimeloyl-ACP methyl ester carboxylesterase
MRKVLKRQTLPPFRKSIGIGQGPDAEVHPLAHRARVTVEDPALSDTWLVHIAGTTADPTIFPPDRTLPQVAFDFRDLSLDEPEADDPYAHFHALIESGLCRAFADRKPRRLVFVGHSFGGMVSADFLASRSLEELQRVIPSLEDVTLVMVCAAHHSPMDRYRIRSDMPLLGPAATWLSHHVTRVGTQSRERLAAVMSLFGSEGPKPIWRQIWSRPDELTAVWDLPRASSIDHFWSVVRCAQQYDVGSKFEEAVPWFKLLILSAERDTQWPADMFEDFWALLVRKKAKCVRWCHFPGDDHLSVARQPTKYYKEIKDFLVSSADF